MPPKPFLSLEDSKPIPRVMHAKPSLGYTKSHARQNKSWICQESCTPNQGACQNRKTIFRKLMSPIKEGNPTTNALAHLEQRLRMRQLTDEHQRRVTTQMRCQVWQPFASMDYPQYGGTLYISNHNFGWSHHPNTSWNTSYTTPHTPQVQRSSLDEKNG